jgi:hypothetical protein
LPTLDENTQRLHALMTHLTATTGQSYE